MVFFKCVMTQNSKTSGLSPTKPEMQQLKTHVYFVLCHALPVHTITGNTTGKKLLPNLYPLFTDAEYPTTGFFTFLTLPYPDEYPPPSSLLNALKYMYMRSEEAMPKPNKM